MRYQLRDADTAELDDVARGGPVYLAGPMTGLADWNYPTFHTAAAVLRHVGIPVHNPAEQHGGKTGLARDVYMRHAMASVTHCAAVVVLPGWETSLGTLLEITVARAAGIPAYPYADFLSFANGHGLAPQEIAVPVVFPAHGVAVGTFVAPVAEPESPRADMLAEASRLITGDRNNTYGPPDQDFRRTAGILNALGFTHEGNPVLSHHVAMIIAAVKLSRLTWSPGKRDNWVDLAGYAACGYECATIESSKENA